MVFEIKVFLIEVFQYSSLNLGYNIISSISDELKIITLGYKEIEWFNNGLIFQIKIHSLYGTCHSHKIIKQSGLIVEVNYNHFYP